MFHRLGPPRLALRRVVALGLGVTTALLVGVGLQRLDQARRVYEQQATVLVAVTDLAVGDALDPTQVRSVHLPAAAVPSDALTDPTALGDATTRVPVVAGGVITRRHLSDSRLVIPDGTRAVSLTAAAGPTVVVGATVDLVGPSAFEAGPSIVTDAVVLAVGTLDDWSTSVLLTVRVDASQLATVAALAEAGSVVVAHAPR